jgi:hypothetical protein
VTGGLPDLEAYTGAVEGHLRARRGTDHVLSPRDFALVRSWHRAGVPLATVLVGIDRAFEADGGVTSLAYCRRKIEELVSSGPGPRARPAPPAEPVPLPELAALMEGLLERLSLLKPGPKAFFETPLRKIQETQDLISVAARPNWDYLRGKLREIDDDVSAAVLQALSAEEVETFRAEAARAVERHRGRVDDAALEDARSRYTVQRARERLGLPRVSVI